MYMNEKKRAGVFIPPERKTWDHERYVAERLAQNGHYVEFLAELTIPTPDICVDDCIKYEIKSPECTSSRTIEHAIKKALRQSPNIIISAYRMKNVNDRRLQQLLAFQVKTRKQIKRMLYITKRGNIIDIFDLT